MAVAINAEPLAPSTNSTKQMPGKTVEEGCSHCRTLEQDVEDAQRKIQELEAQVDMLKEKATAAVDKCADYEDQIRRMRGLPRSNTTDSLLSANGRPSIEDANRPSTANSTSAAKSYRFSFLRRNSPAQHIPPFPVPPSHPTPTATPPPPSTDLISELEKERALRAKAEEKARNVDSEIEELSVQLFSQANEMVAQERKARAKLEERVEVLERRDREKVKRLERLEIAVGRVERVKALLAAPGPVKKI